MLSITSSACSYSALASLTRTWRRPPFERIGLALRIGRHFPNRRWPVSCPLFAKPAFQARSTAPPHDLASAVIELCPVHPQAASLPHLVFPRRPERVLSPRMP